jgi:hypothetical protein
MVLVDKRRLMKEFSHRNPYKRDLLEIRAVGSGLTLHGTGIVPFGAGMDFNKRNLKRLSRQSNYAIPRGRKLLSDNTRNQMKMIKMGRRLNGRENRMGGRMVVQLTGNGLFDSLKRFTEKGLAKAKDVGKKVLDIGKKEFKKQGKQFLSDKEEEITKKIVSKADKLADKAIGKVGEKSQFGSDLLTVMKGEQLRELERLSKKGFDVGREYLGEDEDEMEVEGEGMTPYQRMKMAQRRKPKYQPKKLKFGKGYNLDKKMKKMKIQMRPKPKLPSKMNLNKQLYGNGPRAVLGFKDDLNPAQERFLNRLPKAMPTPSFGADSITELNNLVMSTPISKPQFKKQKQKQMRYGSGLTLL